MSTVTYYVSIHNHHGDMIFYQVTDDPHTAAEATHRSWTVLHRGHFRGTVILAADETIVEAPTTRPYPAEDILDFLDGHDSTQTDG